jgi:hypothetical protein
MSRLHPVVSMSLRLLGVVGLLALRPVSAGAQTSPVPAEVRAAQEFLLSAYPELAKEALLIQLKPNPAGGWLLSVAEAPPPAPPNDPVAPQAPAAVLLRGALTFDAGGRIASYAATGPFLSDGANAVLRDAVRAHPEWTEGDVDAELMRMGAAGAIGQVFTPAAPATAPGLSRHLGQNVSAGAGQFAVRDAGGPTRPAAIRPGWVVEASAINSANQFVEYRLRYEPFGGRLISIETTGGAQ